MRHLNANFGRSAARSKPPGTYDGHAFRDPEESEAVGIRLRRRGLRGVVQCWFHGPHETHDFPQLNCGAYRMVPALLISVVYGPGLVMSRMQA
jgi:hypothetical protein